MLLHCLVCYTVYLFFGIVDVMTGLLGTNGYDTNQGDSTSITPLAWAVRGGQREAVDLLLRQEAANPDKPDNTGKTPLSWAAMKGYEQVVKQLLDRQDVNPGKQDKNGHIPPYYAPTTGHEGVANLLQAWKPPIPALFPVD